MKHVLSPNRWSCIPAAAAMVLDCSLEYLLEKLGHDGSEILWPSLREPLRRKAFHIEEIQYVAIGFGVVFAPFVPALEYCPSDILKFAQYSFETAYNAALARYDGILLGEFQKGVPHAVAWNATERSIYDPQGNEHPAGSFATELFYARIDRAWPSTTACRADCEVNRQEAG